MAPARGLAELLLGTQGSPDVLAGWSVKDLSNSQPSFAATAAAVAAARLAAAAAADYVLVPSKADAVAAPGIGGAGKAHWGGGACPLGYGSKASLTGLKVRQLARQAGRQHAASLHSAVLLLLTVVLCVLWV